AAPSGRASPTGWSRESRVDCETRPLPGRRGEGAAGRPERGPVSCAGAEHDVEPPDEDLPSHDLLPAEPDDAVRVAGLAPLTAGVVWAEIRIAPEVELGHQRRVRRVAHEEVEVRRSHAGAEPVVSGSNRRQLPAPRRVRPEAAPPPVLLRRAMVAAARVRLPDVHARAGQ